MEPTAPSSDRNQTSGFGRRVLGFVFPRPSSDQRAAPAPPPKPPRLFPPAPSDETPLDRTGLVTNRPSRPVADGATYDRAVDGKFETLAPPGLARRNQTSPR